MLFYRIIIRISWTARATNKGLSRRAGMERYLLRNMRRRKQRFVGHILRENGFEKHCLSVRIERVGARGKQRFDGRDSSTSWGWTTG